VKGAMFVGHERAHDFPRPILEVAHAESRLHLLFADMEGGSICHRVNEILLEFSGTLASNFRTVENEEPCDE
jgi:hypothetical protein